MIPRLLLAKTNSEPKPVVILNMVGIVATQVNGLNLPIAYNFERGFQVSTVIENNG